MTPTRAAAFIQALIDGQIDKTGQARRLRLFHREYSHIGVSNRFLDDAWPGMQDVSYKVLVTYITAIRNLQLYQERLFGLDKKQVHDYGSIRKDGRIVTKLKLYARGEADRTRLCAPS